MKNLIKTHTGAHSAAMFSSFNGGVGNRCAEESSVQLPNTNDFHTMTANVKLQTGSLMMEND